MFAMHQLADHINRERLARAEQERHARRYLASVMKSRRAGRATLARRKARPAATTAYIQDGDL